MINKTTRNIATKLLELPAVALRSPTKKENLPLPYVHYPEHYGTFISFSEELNSQQYICSCSEQAVKNYFELEEVISEDKDTITGVPWQPPFPKYYVSQIKPGNKITEIFKFRSKICHRCNMCTPTLRWCHEMYGGNFKQYYGWYIKLTPLKIGFFSYKFLPEICPPEIIEKLILSKKLLSANSTFENDTERELAIRYYKEIEQLSENSTRKEFGFRKIGEGWVSETILYNLVCNLYPSTIIERHIRPTWLEKLELDVYVPEYKIAFEYQGQQHFYPINAWGGEDSFKKLQMRDERKRILCAELGIKLIEIDYTEPLTLSYLTQKIKMHSN